MKSKRVLFILFAGFFLAWLGYATPVLAASNLIYLSSSTQSVTKDSTFTVLLRINSTVAVNAIQANLSYPSSQMTYLSTTYGGSAFSEKEGVEEWGGGGSVVISRHATDTVTGDHMVAVITFKAIVGSGTGTISVQNSSALTGTEPVTVTYGSTTINFAPVPGVTEPINSSSKTTKTNSTKAQVTSTTTPPADTTPPVITRIKSEQATASSQIISWSTNEVSNSLVEYGMDNQYGLSVSDNTMVTDHIINLHSAFLLPNLQFHYRVTSTDASGNKQHGPDLTFTTSGFFYNLTVIDRHGKPLPDAVITLNGQTVYTDDDGKATLATSVGKQTVKITYSNTTASKTVTITPDKAQQIDTIELAADRRDFDERLIIYPGLVLLGLVIGIGSRIRVRKYLLAAIRGERTSFVSLPISSMQKVFGDANPAHNPYLKKHRFSIWAIPKILTKPIGRTAAKTPQATKEKQTTVQPTDPPK